MCRLSGKTGYPSGFLHKESILCYSVKCGKALEKSGYCARETINH